MTNAALVNNSPDQSFLQSAKQILGDVGGHTRASKADYKAEKAVRAASEPLAIAPLNEEDMAYIKAHGARAYAEELQKKIVDEIRQELLTLMGLTQESLSEVSLLQRQTVEGLIAVEIDARLNACFATDKAQADENSTYLKAMMLSQGNYGFFDEQPITTVDDFNKRTASRA